MSGRPVVVVVGSSGSGAPSRLAEARAIADLRFAQDMEATGAAVGEAAILFVWGPRGPWLEEAWPQASGVRWIQSASDGLDGLLFPSLVESDVVVTNARGVFEDPIAEWVIGALLAFATGLRDSITDTPAVIWRERSRGRLQGSTLCVLGPGPIGKATARRARALGMRAIAVGRAPRADDVFERVVGPEGLSEALEEADAVLDALPLTPGTRRYVDERAFASMKPGAVFVNVGRGGTVDEQALIGALRSGRIGGAALDVFDVEPLPTDSPLWELPNVIVSPHVCGDVEGWQDEVVALFLENLGRFVRGDALLNVVDKAAGSGVEGGGSAWPTG